MLSGNRWIKTLKHLKIYSVKQSNKLMKWPGFTNHTYCIQVFSWKGSISPYFRSGWRKIMASCEMRLFLLKSKEVLPSSAAESGLCESLLPNLPPLLEFMIPAGAPSNPKSGSTLTSGDRKGRDPLLPPDTKNWIGCKSFSIVMLRS